MRHGTCSLHEDHVSYLIERKRSGDDGRTTSENVDMPRLNALSPAPGAPLQALLSGNALLETLDPLRAQTATRASDASRIFQSPPGAP